MIRRQKQKYHTMKSINTLVIISVSKKKKNISYNKN